MDIITRNFKIYGYLGYGAMRRAEERTDSTLHEAICTHGFERLGAYFQERLDAYLVPIKFRFLLSEARPEIQREVQRFLSGEFHNLVLKGQQGNGKTTVAWSLCLKTLRANPSASVEFVEWLQLLDLASDAEGYSESARNRLYDFESADLLVLNEFGGTRLNTDARYARIFDLIDSRCSRERRTIYTTNFTDAELVEHVGVRLVDRITEGLNLKFEHPSYRKAHRVAV